MEDAENEKSDLDQYGVWVKTPPHSLQEETVDAQITEVSGTSETEPESEVNVDSFLDTEASDDEIVADVSPETSEEVSIPTPTTDESPSFDDGEISLDEFLDSGDSSSGEISIDSFLDSGDGGDKNFQPDGEISLDDFLDSTSLGMGEQEKPTEEYDEPLDIDLTFDDVDVELDNGSSDDSSYEASDIAGGMDGSDGSGDEILDNFDEMFDNIEDSSPSAPSERSTATNTESESIDLSEFGIEEDSGPSASVVETEEEKPVVQNQDYELDVGDDGFNDGPDTLADESENDDIALEVEDKSDANKTLKPDEKNPYSAPDEDFDVDSLLDSIEDETVPSNDGNSATDAATTTESAPVDINVDESLTPKESDALVNAASFPVDEAVKDDFQEKNDNFFAEEQNLELTETPESGDNVISETEVETAAENDFVEPETSTFAAEETKSDETDSNESVDLYDFMGDEGFSDPSVAEGNRSYSPEELAEQQKEAEEQETDEPAAEEEEQTSLSEENVNQVSDGNIEEETRAGEDMEENFVDKEVPESNQDDELFVDASVGGINNEVLEDDEVVPSPFYSPLVENEGEKQIDFSSEDTEETEESEESEGFIVDADSIVQADMNEFQYDEDSGMVAKPESDTEESESDLDTTQNNAIPDAGEENMDINTNTNGESPDTASLMNEIAKELSVLRQEINELKNEFAEFKRSGIAPSAESAPVEKEENGFFGDMDDDDTIALSGDELSNILSTAEFTEETSEEASAESDAAETVETSAESEEVPAPDENANKSIFGSVEDTPAIPDQEYNSYENNLQVNFADETLQEPNLDDVTIDTDSEVNSLPNEIDVPKVDDILVESSQNDFIGSTESDEAGESEPEVENDFEAPSANEITESESSDDSVSFDEPSVEDDEVAEDSNPSAEGFVSENDDLNVEEDNSISQDDYDYLSKDAPVAEEDEKLETGISEEPVKEVFNTWENANPEEEASEEPAAEESFEAPAPAVDETVEEDEYKEPVFAETQPEAAPEAEESAEPAPSGVNAIPEDMKEEIKSVLAYMDQLLESLPENKIEEFAKSEQFNTYKKLFNELGLS